MRWILLPLALIELLITSVVLFGLLTKTEPLPLLWIAVPVLYSVVPAGVLAAYFVRDQDRARNLFAWCGIFLPLNLFAMCVTVLFIPPAS